MHPKLKRFAQIFLIALVAAVVTAAFLHKYRLYDDAYITYRYAENLVNGNGPVWNPGEKVEGYTSFLHMILAAGMIRIGLNPALMSVLLSLLMLSLTAASGYMQMYREDRRETHYLGLFFVLYLATSPPLICWAMSGMETVLFSSLVFFTMVVLGLDLKQERMPWRAALITATTALARPEGIMLGGIVGLCLLVWGGKKRIPKALVYGLIAGAIFVPWFAWRLTYYGHFYPNTYYAKVGSLNIDLVLRGGWYVIRSMSAYWTPWILFALAIAHRKKHRQWGYRTKIALVFVVVYSLQITISGGDYMGFGRFYLPVLPLTAFAIIGIIRHDRFFREIGPRMAKAMETRPTKSWVLAALILLLLHYVNIGFVLNHIRTTGNIDLTTKWTRVGKIIEANTPKDFTLAGSAVGAIGYFSKRPMIDMLGITDETIAHTPIRTGKGYPGHEKYNIGYVLKRKPDFVAVCAGLRPKPWLECACPRGKQFTRGLHAAEGLLRDPLFKKRYVYSNLEITKGPFAGNYLTGYLLKRNLGKPGYEHWTPATDAGQECTFEKDGQGRAQQMQKYFEMLKANQLDP